MSAATIQPLTKGAFGTVWLHQSSCFLVLACLLVLATCGAREDEVAGPDAAPPLYEITNAKGETAGWMLGTIHALPDGTDWKNSAINEVTGKADRLILEVANLDNNREIAATFARLSTTPNIGPLGQRISQQELQTPLAEMIELSDIGQESFHDTETWAAAIMLARVGAYGDPANGVDRHLIGLFERKEIVGLETAEEQLGVFDGLAPEDQIALLEGTIEEWLVARENPGRLTRAWLSGDEQALLEAATTGIMADKEIRDALLVHRNERWLPIILTYLNQAERPLIAVGAAHLIGPDGLVTMLEDDGFSLHRIP